MVSISYFERRNESYNSFEPEHTTKNDWSDIMSHTANILIISLFPQMSSIYI